MKSIFFKWALWCGLASIPVGCQMPSDPDNFHEKSYYDLAGLMKDQVILLSILNPGLSKRVEKDGTVGEADTHLDSLGWATELQPFYHLDINGPRLKDAYATSKTDSGDVSLITHQLLDRDEDGVQYLKVYRDAIVDDLLKIEAATRVQNFLYQQEMRVTLTFHTDDIGDSHLQSYLIDTEQTMLFSSPDRFSIRGVLTY